MNKKKSTAFSQIIDLANQDYEILKIYNIFYMITFSRLGKKGNLGNQLFQIASTIGLSQKHNHYYFFPEWKYEEYFENKFITTPNKDIKFLQLNEKHFHFHDWEIGSENYDLNGWLQSEKYFHIPLTKKLFTFSPEFLSNVVAPNNSLFQKKTLLVSVRRGDFVNNPIFYQLSYKYYFLGIIENFPDWQERNIVFMSDDIRFCENHFGFLKNAFFIKNLSPIEQLALGTKFDDYVISNSTFSWWLAWLGERKETRIIRPLKNFRDEYNILNNEKDYFPDRWKTFNHLNYQVPLKYKKLIVLAELDIIKTNIHYNYKVRKKKLKNFLKKLLPKKYFTFFYKS